MSRPQFVALMADMMIRFTPASTLLMLALVGIPTTMAWAQTTIPALPAPASAPVTARPAIAVPSVPDMSVPPLPSTPELSDIPTAPVAALPAARFPGAIAGPEPVKPVPDQRSIVYAAGAEPVPADAVAILGDYVSRLKARPAERLELRAYATGRADRPMDGRRAALMRARTLRDQLVKQGIDPLRLVIFAESAGTGTEVGAGSLPPDRVDLVIRQ